MENLHLKIENPGKEPIVFLQGNALEQKHPNIINISGDIKTVSNFLVKRDKDNGGHGSQAVDSSKVIVLQDKKAMAISLKLDPENPFGATFTGKLEFSEELKAFKINQAETFTREQLVKLLRFNRPRFANGEKHEELLQSYQKFNAQAFIDMTNEGDSRGNKTVGFKKEVKTGLPEEFILSLPIFKGQPAETFRVEICLDVTDGGARFWFESVELSELIERRRDEIFEKELEHCRDFVVINQ